MYEEMAQEIRVLAVLSDDPDLILGAYLMAHSISNLSPDDITPLSGLCGK